MADIIFGIYLVILIIVFNFAFIPSLQKLVQYYYARRYTGGSNGDRTL